MVIPRWRDLFCFRVYAFSLIHATCAEIAMKGFATFRLSCLGRAYDCDDSVLCG
jgi:hypothetical protein